MAVFVYQALSEQGERKAGEIEASSRTEALRRLSQERIRPHLLLQQENGKAGASRRSGAAVAGPVRGGIRLNAAQLVLFTEELSEFLHAGLQLDQALHLMANREDRSPVKAVAAFVREKIRDGISFSEALGAASPSFGELYCNMVSAGEVSGALAPLLRRQAQHLVAMNELRGRVQLALMYPSALAIAGIIAVVIFMTVLVPQITSLLVKTGSVMPLPTRILVFLSSTCRTYGLPVGAVIALLVTGLVLYIRQPKGRLRWDEGKLRLPLLGKLMQAGFFAQFCQTMSNLLENGLPLLSSLKLMTRATGNVFYRRQLVRLADLVGEGTSLTRAMKTVGHFPASLRDLLKVGEQTGELGPTLEKIGVRYDKEIQRQIDRVMTAVPMMITVALGLMVLLVGWSMMSGIFEAIHGLQNEASQ